MTDVSNHGRPVIQLTNDDFDVLEQVEQHEEGGGSEGDALQDSTVTAVVLTVTSKVIEHHVHLLILNQVRDYTSC